MDRRLVAAGTGSVGTVGRVWLAQVFVRVESQSLDLDVMDVESEDNTAYLAGNPDQVLA